jgi:hypothetical protein
LNKVAQSIEDESSYNQKTSGVPLILPIFKKESLADKRSFNNELKVLINRKNTSDLSDEVKQ